MGQECTKFLLAAIRSKLLNFRDILKADIEKGGKRQDLTGIGKFKKNGRKPTTWLHKAP